MGGTPERRQAVVRVSRVKAAVFSLVPLLVVAGLTEGLLRVVGWPRAERAFDHTQPYWTVDPGLFDVAMYHGEVGRAFAVSTNDDGLRSGLQRPRSRGRRRIAVMGCSTTFGWGLPEASTYPALLEAELRKGGLDAEVLNAGQPGHTTFQGLWLWQNKVRHYEPDVVVLAYLVQDAHSANYTDRQQALYQADANFLKTHVLYHSRLYLALRQLLFSFGATSSPLGLGADGESRTTRVPLDEYRQNLADLVAEIRAANAVPVLFAFPLERSGYTQPYRTAMAELAQDLKVRHLDPQERMERAAQEAELYFPQDRGHSNAAGNALVAQWLAEVLLAEVPLRESSDTGRR